MNNIKNMLNFIICLCMINMGGGVLFLPNLFDKMPTAFKIVCHSKASLTNSGPMNLFCKNEAKIKIFESQSGQQNKELCFHLSDAPLDAQACNEVIETTRLLKDKCDSKDLCNIDLSESFPCSNHVFSYLNISYSCVPKHVPYKSFAIARFGNRTLNKENNKLVKVKKSAVRTNMKNMGNLKPSVTKRQSLKSLFKPAKLKLKL